jgi:hypothetical protein
MTKLPRALQHVNKEGFRSVLVEELMALESGKLPLHKGSNRGGPIDDSNLMISVLGVDESERSVDVRIGIFFNEIITGGSCLDGDSLENAYCEMMVSINRESAEVEFQVMAD